MDKLNADFFWINKLAKTELLLKQNINFKQWK